MKQALSKNETVRLHITDISNDGNGVGRCDGMAVFVPMAAIGDVLNVKIVKVHKTHAFAIIDTIINPSDDRIENSCAAYRRCGGCSLRHIAYTRELAIKANWVYESLRRIGGVDLDAVTIDPPLSSPASERYRNKAQYPVRRRNGNVNKQERQLLCSAAQLRGNISAGFFAKRSHELIPIQDCDLQPVEFSDIVQVVVEFMEENAVAPYDEETGDGIVRHIFIRRAEASGETMLCLVINTPALPHADKLTELLKARCPTVSTLVLNENRKKTNVIFGNRTTVVFGSGYITDTLCGVKVRLSAQSFYQVNRCAAELLYRTALEYAAPEKTDVLLDLYCGTGTIGLSMAHAVAEVIGVEAVPEAVKDAQQNAAQNDTGNARFLCADALEAAQQLKAEGVRPDIVVLDPPRKGADEKLPAIIADLSPRKLIYISCNPATLARDISRLAPLGYRLVRVRAVDMFPRTAHVECVALLEGS